MSARWLVVPILLLALVLNGLAVAAGAPIPPPPAGQPPAPPPGATGAEPTTATPPRLSYLTGAVSFWRPGSQDWGPAELNTPLAPGDSLYTGQDGTVELQVGPRTFVRAGEGTQISLDQQGPNFIQLRVIAGRVAVDVRESTPGFTIELGMPSAGLAIDRAGYYRADVSQERTVVAARRGGQATLTSANGASAAISDNQHLVLSGADVPRVDTSVDGLDAWDQWNLARTDQLLQSQSAQYVPSGVYGTESLDQYGSWRVAESYGPVWVPRSASSGWSPYSTGRWIWDPRFGWTWLDDAPWGWAPYHYGRWVFVRDYWAWAPGPIVVRPAYAPALVVFLGGASVGRPLCWAPLGWGEPVIPWWGGRGVVGVATWAGWGGPRIVNNVVVNRTTHVDVRDITIYRNTRVANAVVGVPADRFGRGGVRPARVSSVVTEQLTPVRGALDVKPTATSVMPANGPAVRPPASAPSRRDAPRAPQNSAIRPPAPDIRWERRGSQHVDVPRASASSPFEDRRAERQVTPPSPRRPQAANERPASPIPQAPVPRQPQRAMPSPDSRPRITEAPAHPAALRTPPPAVHQPVERRAPAAARPHTDHDGGGTGRSAPVRRAP